MLAIGNQGTGHLAIPILGEGPQFLEGHKGFEVGCRFGMADSLPRAAVVETAPGIVNQPGDPLDYNVFFVHMNWALARGSHGSSDPVEETLFPRL